MFEKQVFVASIFQLDKIPRHNLKVIIMCGRSNVGKSSFINSLFNRKELAKISSTPGKTRSLNYYLIDDMFYLVDLPGYGYAKASKKEREYWGKLITDFIKAEKKIVHAFHLIDSRHKPTELDLQLNDFLFTEGINRTVILTKADKLKQSEYSSTKKNIGIFIPDLVLNENLYFYSAMKNHGRKEILSHLKKILISK